MATISHKDGNFIDGPNTDSITIDHNKSLGIVMTKMLAECIGSDVTFVVEGREFKAHRAVLATRSPVFRKMLLDGSFKEANSLAKPVHLPQKSAAAFDIFLSYLYTCSTEFPLTDLHAVADVLFMAHEYQVDELYSSLRNALQENIRIQTIFQIFEAALILDDAELLTTCRNFMCDNAEAVLKDPQFYDLSKNAIVDIFSNDYFFASEMHILLAVSCWKERNKPAANEVKEVLEKVRLPYVRIEGMTMVAVAPLYELLIANNIDLKLVGSQTAGLAHPRIPSYETENVATKAKGANLGADFVESQLDKFFSDSLSNIGWINRSWVNSVLKLPKVSVFASLSFGVSDSGQYCNYQVAVSVDEANWQLLADCNDIKCNGIQLLMFTPTKFQYVKMVHKNVHNLDYSMYAFKCAAAVTDQDRARYTQHCPKGGTLLYQPLYDSATVVLKAD